MAREKLFKNMKLQEKYQMFLEETRGAEEVYSLSNKYITLMTIDTKGELFWFLGKSGAIRINRKKGSSTSMDVSMQIKPKFTSWCSEKEKA